MANLAHVDLNRIRVFHEVVRSGSFSKAAQLLKQPKSRVSRHVALLEGEIGVQLIYRTTRQFQLTEAGRELYRHTIGLFDELHEALFRVGAFAQDVSGVLRISASEDVGVMLLASLCHEFSRLYPKVKTELILDDRYVDLVNESFDIAVRIGPLSDSSMLQKRVGRVAMAFVASPEFLERNSGVPQFGDLPALPYLQFEEFELQVGRPVLTSGTQSVTLQVNPTFVSNNFLVLARMAMAGAGIALVPRFVAKEALKNGELVELFEEWKSEAAPVHLLVPRQGEPAPRVKRFLEFAAQKLGLSFAG